MTEKVVEAGLESMQHSQLNGSSGAGPDMLPGHRLQFHTRVAVPQV